MSSLTAHFGRDHNLGWLSKQCERNSTIGCTAWTETNIVVTLITAN